MPVFGVASVGCSGATCCCGVGSGCDAGADCCISGYEAVIASISPAVGSWSIGIIRGERGLHAALLAACDGIPLRQP